MKIGWPFSIAIHALGLFGGFILFSKVAPLADEARIIPVDIVSVSEITNVTAAKKIKPGQVVKEPDRPMRIDESLPIAPEPGEATPDRSSDTARETAPQSEQNQLADYAASLAPDTARFDLDLMAALIDKTRETQDMTERQQALQSENIQNEFAKVARDGAGLQTELTMSEVDALRARMYKCWRVSIDARNAQDLIVRVRVQLFPDGSVRKVDLLDRAKIAAKKDPYIQIAAERALRAVSKCAPYDFLPKEKYGSWKDMELSFRPDV